METSKVATTETSTPTNHWEKRSHTKYRQINDLVIYDENSSHAVKNLFLCCLFFTTHIHETNGWRLLHDSSGNSLFHHSHQNWYEIIYIILYTYSFLHRTTTITIPWSSSSSMFHFTLSIFDPFLCVPSSLFVVLFTIIWNDALWLYGLPLSPSLARSRARPYTFYVVCAFCSGVRLLKQCTLSNVHVYIASERYTLVLGFSHSFGVRRWAAWFFFCL